VPPLRFQPSRTTGASFEDIKTEHEAFRHEPQQQEIEQEERSREA